MIEIPLIEVGGLTNWFIGFMVVCAAAFIITLILTYIYDSDSTAVNVVSGLGVLLLIATIVVGMVETSDMKSARTEDIETALDARIISGGVVSNGMLLVENSAGEISRWSLIKDPDAGVILLQPINRGDV